MRDKHITDQNDHPMRTPLDTSEREKTEKARKQVQKRIKDRKIRKLIPLEEIFETEPKYPT